MINTPESGPDAIDQEVDDIVASGPQGAIVVAGIATAGIPHAAWLADRLDLPMVYVRGTAKEHGLNNMIEGHVEPGQTALIIEDLISTGKSAVSAAEALRENDVEVNDCIAIFNYQLEAAAQRFFEAGVNLHPLCNFATLLEVAVKEKHIDKKEYEAASMWNQNPTGWRTKANYSEEVVE